MDPRRGREERFDLVETAQERILPTDDVQVREHDHDDFYETPINLEGYYSERMELRD